MWEPCVGDGRVADALVNGYNVVTGDITTGDDFFEVETFLPHPFIDHAFDIGVEDGLLCPDGCGPVASSIATSDPASSSTWTGVIGQRRSPDRALAVSIWDSPNDAQTHFDVWNRPS